MASNDHDIHVLGALIGELNAASHALSDAAGEDGRFSGLFERRAADQARAARDLEGEVARLGGAPRVPSHGLAEMLGLAQHAFAGLKAKLRHGEGAALDEVERGEAHLLAKFDAALADTGTSGPVRDAILRAYDPIKAGRDEVLQLRESLGGS